MAPRSFITSPPALLHKIKSFAASLVADIAAGRSPAVALDRFRIYCSDPTANCNCSLDVPVGTEIVSIEKESHAHRLDVMLRVLVIVQSLLQLNKHGSKRDIYYMNPKVFTDQAIVDRAINDICILLKCSRHHLNVVPVGKGLVMGWLRYVEAGREVNCMRSLNDAYPIPVSLEEVKDIVNVAQYILVVEKEAAFQRLANDKFCEANRCIIITGRGYPDVPTRRFLRHLVHQLHLPVYCLVDSDPFGFDILMTYKFGSMQMAYDAKLMRVPGIRWLGVFPSDFEKYHLPEKSLLPMTPKDKKKVESMLLRCSLHQLAPQWRMELEIMLHKGVKFEIEALSVTSLSFLSEEYIPARIQEGGLF